jgi:hypothetical protein
MPDSQEAARFYCQYTASLEIVPNIVDIDRRPFLLNMAQDWLKLAEQVENERPHWRLPVRRPLGNFSQKKPGPRANQGIG